MVGRTYDGVIDACPPFTTMNSLILVIEPGVYLRKGLTSEVRQSSALKYNPQE